MPEMEVAAFQELMEHVRKQDDLIHGWIAAMVTTQGGLLAGAGFLWNADSIGVITKALGTVLLALLGMVVSAACAGVVSSESRWQGRYIGYLKSLPGNPWVYADFDVPQKEGGRIVTATNLVAKVTYVIWLVAAVAGIARAIYWTWVV